MALESRSHHKNVLIQDELNKFMGEFKNGMNNNDVKSLDFFGEKFHNYRNAIEKIEDSDASGNTKLLEESNIQDVINFIENTIRPQAAESKEL